MKAKSTITFFTAVFFFSTYLYGQVFSDKVVSEERIELVDSIADEPYPYLLPIWGKKVIEKGFDIPYSAGLGINYVTQESEILVQNLQVGFNNGELIELDEFIRFPSAVATSTVINFRPDIWVFPFLNVYGVLARTNSSTAIDAVLTLPNQDGFEDIFDFSTKVEFEGSTVGFGLTPTIGVAGGWIALDMNFSWSDINELEDPVYTFVFGPRIGKTFHFRRPDQNIAVWVGAFRVDIKNETSGSLPFSEIFDFDGSLQEKIDDGMQAVVTKQQELDDWFNALSPPQQVVNRPKYEAATTILGAANNFLFRLEDAGQRIADSSVQYNIDKRQKNLWNMVVGGQYQFNKNLMVRAEFGFLGERTQFIGGLQYRFRL
ncbi:hypothetical protein [Aureitalea marina]|uniref:Uncharacterized protein n=1 Tax=Aureitalea marina TaxID=930804 RepID=A0A2S7KNZ1_9FLAO|nr:hypothetical protein [Aureitalea marina]PQB04335.1 hypothetical protein BST85_05050 [Aureitalea marina]